MRNIKCLTVLYAEHSIVNKAFSLPQPSALDTSSVCIIPVTSHANEHNLSCLMTTLLVHLYFHYNKDNYNKYGNNTTCLQYYID